LLTTFAALFIYGCQQESGTEAQNFEPMEVNYPETKTVDTVDEYHGVKVSDPYRWLEDDRAEDTEDWVKRQNEVTFAYLEDIPYRADLQERLTELMDYEKYSAPFVEGDYTYFSKNDGLQNQSVIYRQKEGSEPEVFLDPNKFSEDGTTSLAGLSFTEDGSLAAYSISEGGSDWRKVIVMDAETKYLMGDTMQDVKFSGVSWKGNDGFFYSSYDKPEEGSELSGKTQYHKLYYHKLGTPQQNDILVFGGEDQPHRYVGGYVSENQNWLVISAANSTSGNKLFLQDLTTAYAPIRPIVDNDSIDHSVVHVENNTLYIKTNLDAPNGRVVKVDAANPTPENWETVIEEREQPLSLSTGGGYFFAEYMKDALSTVEQYDLNGISVRTVELPGQGSVYGFSGKWDADTLYYNYSSYINPSTIYAYDVKRGTSTEYKRDNVDFDPSQYVSKQVFYYAEDSTKIPMMITHKKGLELNGDNPTMLYGYGGFNVSLTPSFSAARVVWLENGGVYAVPNIRGGGEYGKEWHKAGTQMNKQNVFNDFIAAAEYLIEEGYTTSDRLAISGGSNGGLLVGAVMTQRPELMKVALPAVGVLDMLRYHEFTAGAGWAYDYGTADQSKEMFEYLKSYSPYHNIKPDQCYPATMVTTADHDDRVVPAHSFKFAARLQNAQQDCEMPALIRIETDAGHGAGKPMSKIIEEQADKYAFTFFNLAYPLSFEEI